VRKQVLDALGGILLGAARPEEKELALHRPSADDRIRGDLCMRWKRNKNAGHPIARCKWVHQPVLAQHTLCIMRSSVLGQDTV